MLLVAVISAFEGLKVDFSRTGKDYQSGSHQRNVFYFALMAASLYKFLCMCAEVHFFADESACSQSHICAVLRFSPDLPLLATYALMIVFLTQLCYDVTGVPSVAPKNTFIACVIVVAVLFFPCLLVNPPDDPNINLFRFLGLVHLALFVVIIFAGVTVSRRIPSGITIGQRILSRLIAICAISGYSTLVGVLVYFVALRAVWSLAGGASSDSPPQQRLLLFDGIVVLLKDVVPLLSILYFTSKRSTTSAPAPVATHAKSSAVLVSSSASATSANSSASNHAYTRIDQHTP